MTALERIVVLAAVGTIASGCIPPRYSPASNEPVATLRVMDGAPVSLCRKGERFQLQPAAPDGLAAIPAGTPISVGRTLSYQTYDGMFIRSIACRPEVSFVAEPGETYVFDLVISRGVCLPGIARIDPTTQTGLATVKPSVAACGD